VKFAFIQQHLIGLFPLRTICVTLGVSVSGYHAWRRRLREPVSPRKRRREELAEKVRMIHEQNRRVYGSPRVHRALLAGGEKVCVNTVANIMKDRQIRAQVKRRFVPRTTDSTHHQPVAENVLDRQFHADAPDRKWVCDITYIPTDEGWLYLAGVLDVCSRKVVGWSMAEHLRSGLVEAALAMAVTHRRPGKDLLHHSDRGVQYACDDYQHLLREHHMIPSMSGKGDCYDNAVMESFWATLKVELVHRTRFATRAQALASIFEYIEVFYNRIRLHSTLGYQSPEAFEASLN